MAGNGNIPYICYIQLCCFEKKKKIQNKATMLVAQRLVVFNSWQDTYPNGSKSVVSKFIPTILFGENFLLVSARPLYDRNFEHTDLSFHSPNVLGGV